MRKTARKRRETRRVEKKEAKKLGEQEVPAYAFTQLKQVPALRRVPGLSEGMGP